MIIRVIWEAQIAAGDSQIELIEPDAEGDSDSTISCIKVDII